MKVYVFKYVGDYGGGLVFIGPKYKELEYYLSDKETYELIGVFDLPEDFLSAIDLEDEHNMAYWVYYE